MLFKTITICLVVLFMPACSGGGDETQQAGDSARTVASDSRPATTVPVTPTVSPADLERIALEAARKLEEVFDVERVTLSRFTDVAWELEIILTWSCRDRIAGTHFELVSGLVDGIKPTDTGWLGLKMVTLSEDSTYRYESFTNHDTILALYRRQISVDQWIAASGAAFTQEPRFGC